MQQTNSHRPEALVLDESTKNANHLRVSPTMHESALALKQSLQQSHAPESPRHLERHDVKETTRNSLLSLAQQIFYPLLGV